MAVHNARVVLPDPPAPLTLYGRVRESRVLEGLLGSARERGDALVLVGEPGIGKSSLIAAAAANARASGFQILTATGVQSEAEIPFAGLHQLTRALQGEIDSLPSPQRQAMLAAFGRESSAAPDRFLIALAALDLLSDAATHSPLPVIAEDAQWLDRPTCDVLTFFAPRFESDPITLLMAVREGSPRGLVHSRVSEVHLDPL